MRILLLRGLGREIRHWGRFPQELADNLGWDVRCLDLPGIGTELGKKSVLNNALGTVEGPHVVAQIVDDLRARVSFEAPFAIFGVSLGGLVALEWARLYPNELSWVSVANTTSAGISEFWRRMQLPTLVHFVSGLLHSDARCREQIILSRTSNLHGLVKGLDKSLNKDFGIAQAWSEFSLSRSQLVSLFRLQLKAAAKCHIQRGPYLIKLQVMGSARDRLAHVSATRQLAAHVGATFCQHDTAGHDICLDDAPWVIAQLHQFAFSLK